MRVNQNIIKSVAEKVNLLVFTAHGPKGLRYKIARPLPEGRHQGFYSQDGIFTGSAQGALNFLRGFMEARYEN